jgi:hypothetical protein
MERMEDHASNNSSIVAYIFVASFTEPFPSNDKGIQIQTQRLMERIYEVRRWDGLRCHDIYTKFHKDWSDIQKLLGKYNDTQTAWWLYKPIFILSKKGK